MKAKELRAILAPILKPAFSRDGFLRMPGSKVAWYAEGRFNYLCLEVRSDPKYGYDPLLGGGLYFRGWRSSELTPHQEFGTRIFTASELMAEADRCRFYELETDAVAKVLARNWNPWLRDSQHGAAFAKIRGELLARMSQPYHARIVQDAMRYVDEADVANWANLIVTALPSAIETLDSDGIATA